jgi:hypothetical protein
MRKLLLPVLAILSLAGWYGWSALQDMQVQTQSNDLRAEACAVMDRAASLSTASQRACEIEDAAYLDALARSAEVISDKVRENLAASTHRVNQASEHIEEESFTAISLSDFLSTYDVIGLDLDDGNSNAALDLTTLQVSGLHPEFGHDPAEGPPSLWINTSADETTWIAIDPRINSLFEDELGFTCFDIRDVDHGCQGQIFLRNSVDDISVTPTIVGLRLEPLSKAQAKAAVMALFQPSFEEGREESDADRMRQLIHTFTPENHA